MGHANLKNLSGLFVNLLYAKGRISIADAVKVAQQRGEELSASEGGYDDEGMLGYAFEQIVESLWLAGRHWRPDPGETVPMHFIVPVITLAEAVVKFKAKLNRDEVAMFAGTDQDDSVTCGIFADMLQENRRESLACYVRELPTLRKRLGEFGKSGGDSHEWDVAEYEQLSRIQWRFADGWRTKYRNIPLLSHVSN